MFLRSSSRITGNLATEIFCLLGFKSSEGKKHRTEAALAEVIVPQLLLVTTLPILIQSMLRIKITLPILIIS
jgi:hypothetical protein